MSSMQSVRALALEGCAAARTLEIRDLEAPLGARVTGIDIREPQEAAEILAMKKALADRHVLLLRGQQPSDEEFLRF
ncbi:hypothetical protein ABTN05_19185, partial [Acinetobacter baumannii]